MSEIAAIPTRFHLQICRNGNARRALNAIRAPWFHEAHPEKALWSALFDRQPPDPRDRGTHRTQATRRAG